MGELIAVVGRALLVIFAIRLLFNALTGSRSQRRSQRSGGTPPRADRPAGGGRPQERSGGQLVRDPQCGTYVAESNALTAVQGGVTYHFCSERCRDAHAAARAAS